MKKILTILGTITLIGTSTNSLVACNNIINKAGKPPEGSPWRYVSSILGEGNTKKWYCDIFKKKIINEILPNEKVIKNFFLIIMIVLLFCVFRWDDDSEPELPFISPVTGQIIDWKL